MQSGTKRGVLDVVSSDVHVVRQVALTMKNDEGVKDEKEIISICPSPVSR